MIIPQIVKKEKRPHCKRAAYAQKNTFNWYNVFKKVLTFALNGCIIKTVKDHTHTHGGNNYEKAHC